MLKTFGRKKSFDLFEKNYLKINNHQYLTSQDLQIDPPIADAYICGSDQIWNPNLPNGKEPAYYLDFGFADVRRISYAASFGAMSLPEDLKSFVSKRISKLNAISVREKTGIDILKTLGINNGVQTLDPVFLLSKEEWHYTERKRKIRTLKRPYIFLYEFIGDSDIKDFVLKIAKSTGCQIVSVNDNRIHKYVDININDAGPSEFLYLLSHAEMVICNSFHATAFAIIYEKEFYSFPIKSQKSSTRMEDLCRTLNLSSRYNPSSISGKKIDFNAVNIRLKALKMDSINFLKNALD